MSFLHTVSVSYQIRAPAAQPRSPPKPQPAPAAANSEEHVSDSEEPALVRFARRKQREQEQQSRAAPRVINTPPNPERWTVKDTSVNIASAFHAAAGVTAIPAYDSSASSSSAQNTFNTSVNPMNPNDLWAAGKQPRSALPRSTSVEYEKETQSTRMRRLALPERNNGLPRARPLSRTDSANFGSEGDSSQEIPQNGRAKTFGEQVMDATRRLAPATFFMRRQSEEPELRLPLNDTSKDKSSSYDYENEERDYLDTSQQENSAGARRNVAAHRRNRISVDNKAYKPSLSDLSESESDSGSDGGKRTKKRRGKKGGGTGGPLRTLPVAGYDKRKKKRKNGIMDDGDEGSDDEPLPEYSAEPVRFANV